MYSSIRSLLSIPLPIPNHCSNALIQHTPQPSRSIIQPGSVNGPAPSPLQVLIPPNPDPLNQPLYLTSSSFRTPLSQNSHRPSVVNGEDGNRSGSARRTLFSNNSSSNSPSDKVANNMKRLYTKITEYFDGLDMDDAQQIIRNVKTKHTGLRGLTMKVILADAIEIVCQMNKTPERSAPGGRGPVTLARPLHDEPCMDVNCTDFLQYCKYKTELCPHFEQFGRCKLGDKCVYAHGREELRPIRKLRVCNGILKFGYCSYGEKCLWAHSPEELYSETEEDRRRYNEQYGLGSLSGTALSLPVSKDWQASRGGALGTDVVDGVDMTGTGIWCKAASESTVLAEDSRRPSLASNDENAPAFRSAVACQSAPVLSSNANVFLFPCNCNGNGTGSVANANSPQAQAQTWPANSALLQPFANDLFAALSPRLDQPMHNETAQMMPKPMRTKANFPIGREGTLSNGENNQTAVIIPATCVPAQSSTRSVLNETHNGPFSLPGGFRSQIVSALSTVTPNPVHSNMCVGVPEAQPLPNICPPEPTPFPSDVTCYNLLLEACRFAADQLSTMSPTPIANPAPQFCGQIPAPQSCDQMPASQFCGQITPAPQSCAQILAPQLCDQIPMHLQSSVNNSYLMQEAAGGDIPPPGVAPQMLNVSPNQLENADTSVRSRFEVSNLGFGGSLDSRLQTPFCSTNGEMLAWPDGSACSKLPESVKYSDMYAPECFCGGCCMSLFLRPVITLPCKHVLHAECAFKWTSQNGGCPLCGPVY